EPPPVGAGVRDPRPANEPPVQATTAAVATAAPTTTSTPNRRARGLILLVNDMVQGLLSLLNSQQRLRCRSGHGVLASVHSHRSLSAGPTGGQPVFAVI